MKLGIKYKEGDLCRFKYCDTKHKGYIDTIDDGYIFISLGKNKFSAGINISRKLFENIAQIYIRETNK